MGIVKHRYSTQRIGLAAASLACVALALWSVAVPAAVALVGALFLTLAGPLLGEHFLFLLAPLFSRLQNIKLLDQEVRSAVIDLLRQAPGLGLTDVARRLDIGWGTAVHHLNLLERAGLVASENVGRHRRFFVKDEDPKRRDAVRLLSSDLNRRLALHIRENPGTTQTQTCQALGIKAPLAHKYLSRLQRENYVTATRQWRNVQYYPAERLSTALSTAGDPQGPDAPIGSLHPSALGAGHDFVNRAPAQN